MVNINVKMMKLSKYPVKICGRMKNRIRETVIQRKKGSGSLFVFIFSLFDLGNKSEAMQEKFIWPWIDKLTSKF
jgi:hypothetical protein